MDQLTFQTIIEGGILVTLVYLGGRLIGIFQGIVTSLNDIANSTQQIASNTSTGGSGTGTKGSGTGDKSDDKTK